MLSRLAVLLAIFAGVFATPAFADDLDAILSKAAAGKKAPGAGLGPIDIQDSNRLRDVIHEFPESNLELVGWPGGMN